jgi:hypothetical protein
MKKTNLNIVPEDPYLVLIALNPTEEALENNAVFSRDEGFWNLLRDAGLIYDVSEVPLSKRATEVFCEQKHSTKKIGFADLLPLVYETDSKKVKPEKGSAIKLLKEVSSICKAKKIGLLGQKVVDAFANDYCKLTKWKDIKVINGERQFGKIGNIDNIEIYAMPFPVNNKIPQKHHIYKMLQ